MKANEAGGMPGAIDFHTHVFPDEIAERKKKYIGYREVQKPRKE